MLYELRVFPLFIGTKRILKQAALFTTVGQVKNLEDAANSAPEPTYHIIAGFACSLIQGRGRFSYMQFARNIIKDYDMFSCHCQLSARQKFVWLRFYYT